MRTFDLLGNTIDALIETPPIAGEVLDHQIIRGDNTSTRLARISGNCWRRKRGPWHELKRDDYCELHEQIGDDVLTL
jgi:hypothetical protein